MLSYLVALFHSTTAAALVFECLMVLRFYDLGFRVLCLLFGGIIVSVEFGLMLRVWF